MRPFTDSSELRDDGPALRARFAEDGYIFMLGVLAADAVRNLRRQLLDIVGEAGWLRADRPREEAVADLESFCYEPQPQFMDVFYRQLGLQDLVALTHHPDLRALFETLFEEPVFVHPHMVMRNIFPQREAYTTPAHQDFVHLQGSFKCCAAWIPFCDVDADMGGLALARGSHRGRVYDMRPTNGAGQMEVDASFGGDWVNSPCRMGDVLIHNTLLVHKGVPNRSDRMRISVDARYQPLSEPICERSLVPSHQMADWERIYRDWPNDDYKYYWQDIDQKVVPFTYKYHDRRDKLAVQWGERGDSRAYNALENIIAKHRDPAMRTRAAEALKNLMPPVAAE